MCRLKGFATEGDVNDDGQLDLTDVIISIKTTAGLSLAGITRKADSDGDRIIDMPDALFQLRRNIDK